MFANQLGRTFINIQQYLFNNYPKKLGIFHKPEDPSLPCTSAVELDTVLCFGSFSLPIKMKK